MSKAISLGDELDQAGFDELARLASEETPLIVALSRLRWDEIKQARKASKENADD